jgi:PAS domain S-box-containing protein
MDEVMNTVDRKPNPRSKWPTVARLLTMVTVVLMAWVVIDLRRLNPSPFMLFLVPMLLASLIFSIVMAAHWREWRALPLSLVFALLAGHEFIEAYVQAGVLPAAGGWVVASRLLMWASVPVTFGAIAGLWRIFENQALFKRAQRDVLEHEARYRHLIENASDAFYTADAIGRLTLVNASAARLFGWRAGDLINMSFYDFVDEDTRRTMREGLDTLRTRDIRAFYHEFPIVRRDGTQRWVGQNLQVLLEGRQIRGFQAVLRDITDRREAQEALRRSESRLRTLFETMSEGVIQARLDGLIEFVNPAAERILGYSAAELQHRHYADPMWEFLRADGQPMPVEEWVGFRAHKSKQPVGPIVTGVRHKTGSIVWLSATAVPLPDKGYQAGGVAITFADISKSKVAEENLRIIEFALDSAMEHVFLATDEGRLVYANKSALRALEYTTEAITSKTIFDIAPEVTGDDWNETWRRAKAGDWPTFESRFVTMTGRTYPALTSASHLRFNRREYLFAFAHDLSREVELATQLRHAQKMEAIGVLAGGIAHDFNNILGGVLGYADLALQDTPPGSPVRLFLQEIVAGSNRAADLVRQILTFSRRTEQKQQPLRPAPVIKEALKLLKGTLPATIEIRQQLDAGCGPIMADPGQIHQVLMNLCTNAYHAMKDSGGVLTVDLREVAVGNEWTSAEFILAPGRYAQLSVADTGCGMDAETLRRIFEPFFSTKKQGEGTGLGLASVHGIVKSHKGGVRVESVLGKGTRFDILFPLYRTKEEAPQADAEAGAPLGGLETVLFVDDEAPIALSTREALRRLGYTVETAASGPDALALFEAAPRRFDLVITDQTMPQMTGFELARRLMQVRPDARIILCTGFTETVTRDDIRNAGIQELVPKPFTLHSLTRAMRAVMASPVAIV